MTSSVLSLLTVLKIVKIKEITAGSPDDNQVRYEVLYPDGIIGNLTGDELDSQNKFEAGQPINPSKSLEVLQRLEQSATQVYIPEKMKVSMPDTRARLLFCGDERSPETIFK
ncbi:MAG: hypothetical protein JO066_06370 [Verrucomicrobia bacterium]|nr:hypothetical protein [Verrucomicrobiota bacterium]